MRALNEWPAALSCGICHAARERSEKGDLVNPQTAEFNTSARPGGLLNQPGAARASTGVEGLDLILGGGLTPSRMYLVEGTPGTGKTTFALKFLMAGVSRGERGLYITLSETAAELRAVVASHGWTLDGIEVFELVNELGLSPDVEQSILHPSEVELGETIKSVIETIERINPERVVFDSLSEMRLLAQDPLRYRRQVLALKHFFASRKCTVLMLDDKTSDPGDLQLHSIAHGVISLEQTPQRFGAERRQIRIAKMRGTRFKSGFHDFLLDTGRVEVFPRLVAADHAREFVATARTTGSPELDDMLGGGLSPGTNTLLMGPSGVGKTTTAISCMLAALQRGERCDFYLFDEGRATLLLRSAELGMDLKRYIDNGQLVVQQIDPSALSPGEFAHRVMRGVKQGSTFVVIDSLNAYVHAMPGQSFLTLHMHELLSFLNHQGVTTLVVLGQHGVVGELRSEIDLSYLADSILLYRFFEAHSEVRTALSAVKSRTAQNQRTIREFRLSSGRGLQIGDALRDFEGVLSGLPAYRGKTPMLGDA
jgi:circadian clock protein KaiC